MHFKLIYPYTLEVKAEYEVMTDEIINNSLSLAEKTFKQWRKTSFKERRALMLRAADLLYDQTG